MYKFPKAFNNLVESFRSLPGVGKKTAERYALSIINSFKNEEIEEFITNLDNIRNDITKCPKCGVYLNKHEECELCDIDKRENKKLLIVDSLQDVIAIENLNIYKGLYFNLEGNIIKNKITVSKNIDRLLDYIKKINVEEIILANNATIEGETTARYLKELLRDFTNLKLTRLAYGLPVGQDLEFADELTLLRALEGRNKY